MVLDCTGLPGAITSASGADLEKDFTVSETTSLSSPYTASFVDSFITDADKNTNIYKLFYDAAGWTSAISVNDTTFAPTPTLSDVISKFSTTNMGDSTVESILSKYGFTPLTSMTGTSKDVIDSQITTFENKVQFTYCCYQKLYNTALTDVFTGVSSTNSSFDTTKRKRAIKLNIKLSIIIAGLNRINTYFNSKASSIMATSNTSTTSIQTTNANLQSQLSILTSKDADRQLYTRMVEYTEEKNQAHRNLLGMYTVLNLVALGLIFYIAKD